MREMCYVVVMLINGGESVALSGEISDDKGAAERYSVQARKRGLFGLSAPVRTAVLGRNAS